MSACMAVWMVKEGGWGPGGWLMKQNEVRIWNPCHAAQDWMYWNAKRHMITLELHYEKNLPSYDLVRLKEYYDLNR